jgi:osmoprotectant transport system permease protein
VIAFLLDVEHWRGADGIPVRVGEHILLSGTALVVAMLLALPLGVWLGHTGRAANLALNLANVGRALPSLAILALALPLVFALGLGLGFWPTVIALVPLGVPLILTNTYAAVRAVDRDVIDVARGLGMTGGELLRDVELPLALPVVVGGVRNAAVTIVATAPLGALVASGGLGRYVVDGLARQESDRLVAGALLVSLLAIATELAFDLLARVVIPGGVRAARRTAS